MKKLLLFIFACYSFNAQSQVTNGLTAKYSFNYGNANDEIGTNNGIIFGATPSTDRFGNPNHAYYFEDGDYIALLNSPALKSSNMTISIWVKFENFLFSSVNKNHVYVVPNAPSGANFMSASISLDNSGQMFCGSQNTSGGSAFMTTSAFVNYSNWHHIVLAFGFDSLHTYVNGVKQSMFKGFNTIYTNDSVFIGKSGHATWKGNLNGYVDDLRVYDRVLSPAEVDSLYNEANPCIFNPTVNISGVTLTAAIAGASYQWIDCSNNSPISNATSQSYTPTSNGNYAVIVSQNNCTDTSNCITISTVGINESRKQKTEVYPNPANNRLNIDLASEAEIEIYAITGKLMDKFSAKQNHIVDISAYPNGMYFVKTQNETIKFVKQ